MLFYLYHGCKKDKEAKGNPTPINYTNGEDKIGKTGVTNQLKGIYMLPNIKNKREPYQ